MRQFGVANPGKAQNTRFAHGASLSLAKAGPMSGAQPMSEANALAAAIALGLTCDRRLELVHFSCAAE